MGRMGRMGRFMERLGGNNRNALHCKSIKYKFLWMIRETTMANEQKTADLVVGVDGSQESFGALRWALTEASLTGQKVNAVYGWTQSWDMGERPQTDEEWERLHKIISLELDEWVAKASAGLDFDRSHLEKTSVHAAGSTALLELGQNAQQIVVGRRSLSRLARWFLGSISDSLIDQATVPVTVVRGQHLQPDQTKTQAHTHTQEATGSPSILVGIDGSSVSGRALKFAASEAARTGCSLKVLYCWKMKSLGELSDRTHAIPSKEEAHDYANKIVRDIIEAAHLPADLHVEGQAVHAEAVKGLTDGSATARRLIVGSRGLTGLDAFVLGSVSKQLIDSSLCPLTIVH